MLAEDCVYRILKMPTSSLSWVVAQIEQFDEHFVILEIWQIRFLEFERLIRPIELGQVSWLIGQDPLLCFDHGYRLRSFAYPEKRK